MPLVHVHKEADLNFWLNLAALCSIPGHGDIKEWLHRGMLPLQPPWGLLGALPAAGMELGRGSTHLPAASRSSPPGPRRGSAGEEGQGWCCAPPDGPAAAATGREDPGRRRGPDPSPPGLATGSAHLSSAVTDTGRDESALSIVTCTQNRAKPCSSPGLRVQVSQERLLNHWELVV